MPTLSFQPPSAPTSLDFHPRPRLSSQEPWRRIRVARFNPGIPEQLFGSSTSMVLRLGDERVGGKHLFKISALFPTPHKAFMLCFVLWSR